MKPDPKKTALLDEIFSPRYWVAFWQKITDNALNASLKILGILLVYLLLHAVLYRLIDGVLARFAHHEAARGVSEERKARLQTLQGLAKSILGYVMFIVFGILLLMAIGFDPLPLLTTAGVAGLAVGFGAQKLVKDFITGFFIVVDNLFVVGDTVTISGITGQVREMGMRVTSVQDATGKLHIFSNGDIGTVANLSRYPVEENIEFQVGAAADLSKVREVADAAGEALFASEGHSLKAAPHVLGMTAFSAASVTIQVSILTVPRELPNERMRVRAAVRKALLAAEIPLA